MNIEPPPRSILEFSTIWKDWFYRLWVAVKDNQATVHELIASGAVARNTQSVELNHASVVVAATIEDTLNHAGLFIVKNTSAGGTEAHTLTLTSGTFDGTNTVATLDAPGEALVVYFDSSGDGVVIENIGAVALS